MPQEAAEEADDGEVPVEEPAKKRRRRKNEASPHEAQLTEAGKPAGALVFEKMHRNWNMWKKQAPNRIQHGPEQL